MSLSKRFTFAIGSDLHRELRIWSRKSGRTVSDLVREAIRRVIAEDLSDLAAIDARRREPRRTFESFLADQKRRRRT